MNLQVHLNDLVNKKKMVEYKLSKLGLVNILQKRKFKKQLEELNKEIDLSDKIKKLADSNISDKV